MIGYRSNGCMEIKSSIPSAQQASSASCWKRKVSKQITVAICRTHPSVHTCNQCSCCQDLNLSPSPYSSPLYTTIWETAIKWLLLWQPSFTHWEVDHSLYLHAAFEPVPAAASDLQVLLNNHPLLIWKTTNFNFPPTVAANTTTRAHIRQNVKVNTASKLAWIFLKLSQFFNSDSLAFFSFPGKGKLVVAHLSSSTMVGLHNFSHLSLSHPTYHIDRDCSPDSRECDSGIIKEQ